MDEGEKLTAIDRLEQLLNEREREVRELKEKLNEIEEQGDDKDWRWARHTRHDAKDETLPVPRLELRCTPLDEDWYRWHWVYALVYRHVMGTAVYVPLGGTIVTGGNREEGPVRDGKLDLPWRDGVHIRHESEQFNLPAFAICGDIVQELTAAA